ncbi:metastasis-associated protein MTA3 [Eurytemora carolleeae]|uniref:metastasis-associated protein MTA3 n=1 Tax=Eurytemora carolleeae TaxID=1294199 RepID=UPI000C78B076|nr:metastasis-associated protein MTA3 [Eurytemora carolleeae]|eukprot:XP_023321180.1 metastasis-associated protein MTA3-like [Eurytemora affinis]
MSAAAASRDVTLFNAMGLLHASKYDFAKAALSLVNNGSPRLSTDQMEEWTTAEAALFEEAMEKHGKAFNDIWTDYMPWKTVKNLVDYYYTWKTTDRYVQQKRLKAAEHETKLKQVYVPDYTKHGEQSLLID